MEGLHYLAAIKQALEADVLGVVDELVAAGRLGRADVGRLRRRGQAQRRITQRCDDRPVVFVQVHLVHADLVELAGAGEARVKDDEVLKLQKFLNTHGYILSSFGNGSQGNETNYFGKRTKSALIKFQKFHFLNQTGSVDNQSRKVLNEEN